MDPRDEIVARLVADLLGPSAGPLELIEERPSDRYLTGILFPQKSAAGEENDDRLDVGAGDEGDGTAADQVPSMRLLRPASAGVSFSLRGDHPSIEVEVRCAKYEPQVEIRSEEAQPETSAGASADLRGAQSEGVGSSRRGHHRTKWLRRPLITRCRVEPSDGDTVSLDTHGIPGMSLAVQWTASDGDWLVTVVLVNNATIGSTESRGAADARAFFQVWMEIQPSPGVVLPARPSRHAAQDEDGRASALLYRDAMEFAVGHTCSADWTVTEDGRHAAAIRMSWLPSADVHQASTLGGPHFAHLSPKSTPGPLDATRLAEQGAPLRELLTEVPDAYQQWIDEQRLRIPQLPVALQAQAASHLDDGCARAVSRMRAGIDYLSSDADAREAFRLANLAMAKQFAWARGTSARLTWRPFQMGFLLLTIESVGTREHRDRELMDLLWFPTGGGKTEAYLALVAFTLFHRRLRHAQEPERGAGTAAIMRYTLRLLTTQQFQRASALVMACEWIRRSKASPDRSLGETPLSIGLWVGDEAVANTRERALIALKDNSRQSPAQLQRCPACGTSLRWEAGPQQRFIMVSCTRDTCDLASEYLPIWTVDEDIYERLPSLVIATIDKFAQLPRREEAGRFFGLRSTHDAPDLIIQDELHLISGPLGTVAGLFEAAIDRLCERGAVRPKVIGSTATIRRASEQIRALFDRTGFLFPPPGLDASDSCFAVRDTLALPRRYVAVTTAGRSAKFTLQAVAASLLQSASQLAVENTPRDAYWTLVAYFNALRELGGALVLMQDDVPASMSQFALRRGEHVRELAYVAELTSRLAQSELTKRLAELEEKEASGNAIDAVLATNMISVGIDIVRLGLMIVNGQPKSIAEYIQATSRVGRGSTAGLVVAIYNNAKARDRSRFETFRSWHDTLYREVEATSVTPFSSRARDRSLTAVLATLVRHLVAGREVRPTPFVVDESVRAIEACLQARAAGVDPEEEEATAEQLMIALEQWEQRQGVSAYFNDYKPATALMISAERAAALRAARREAGEAWPIPSSMRSVEPMTKVAILEHLQPEPDEEEE